MDLAQALLAYMALTVSLSFGSSALHEDMVRSANAPVVSVVEQAPEVTPQPYGGGEVAIIGSVVVTSAPATPAPAPTMTPNPAYGVVRPGNRGQQVRKIQERLRELGYLNGNVDGAYGGQTRNAVIAFQKENGLTPDGIAGKSTQTRLFDDPDVIPNPLTVTPTPVPTATPDPGGIIPVAEDIRTQWKARTGARFLCNGQMFSSDQVFLWSFEDSEMVSITRLAEMAGWTLSDEGCLRMKLELLGYTLSAELYPSLLESRDMADMGYCQAYHLTVGEAPEEARQGWIAFENGEWFMNIRVFTDFLKADMWWDGEETTLVMNLRDSVLASSAD